MVFYQEHDTNPFTKQPLSTQYKKILEMRKKLPVYTQMDDFYKMVSTVNVHPELRRGLSCPLFRDMPTLLL